LNLESYLVMAYTSYILNYINKKNLLLRRQRTQLKSEKPLSTFSVSYYQLN
jgi:hypothetical protein